MTVGLAMLFVKSGSKCVKACSGDRPAGERHIQLVGLAAIA